MSSWCKLKEFCDYPEPLPYHSSKIIKNTILRNDAKKHFVQALKEAERKNSTPPTRNLSELVDFFVAQKELENIRKKCKGPRE